MSYTKKKQGNFRSRLDFSWRVYGIVFRDCNHCDVFKWCFVCWIWICITSSMGGTFVWKYLHADDSKGAEFGAITIMGVVMGLFFFASGHFVLPFAANIVCGVVADLVAKAFDYRNKKRILLSCIIFSFGLTGSVLPMRCQAFLKMSQNN